MQITKNKTQNGNIVINLIVLICVTFLVILLGYFTWKNLSTKPNSPKSQNTSEMSTEQTAQDRDKLRKKHATTLASRLFAMRYINNISPDANQAGFEQIALRDGQEPLIDPLTNKPYTFSNEQSAMNVGEATFKLDATCDNKISGSNGKGLIISTKSESVAVAIKLESGAYACDTNL